MVYFPWQPTIRVICPATEMFFFYAHRCIQPYSRWQGSLKTTPYPVAHPCRENTVGERSSSTFVGPSPFHPRKLAEVTKFPAQRDWGLVTKSLLIVFAGAASKLVLVQRVIMELGSSFLDHVGAFPVRLSSYWLSHGNFTAPPPPHTHPGGWTHKF